MCVCVCIINNCILASSHKGKIWQNKQKKSCGSKVENFGQKMSNL